LVDITDIVLLYEENIDELATLENLCFSDPWSANMFLGDFKSGHTFYYGAFDGDKLIGYIGMLDLGEETEITNVAVHPDYRRRGIASKLISEILKCCINNYVSEIHLEVRESNESAILLYQKFGFEKVGLRKKYYKNPTENAILMTKTFLEERDD